MTGWVDEEIARCRMADARLKSRLGILLERLGEHSTQSIPAACRGWAETQAAYRFLNNGKVDARDILDGHSLATLGRISREPVVLLVQDTTFLEYVRDAGKHDYGTLRRSRREEYLLHPTVAFTPERTNLGVLGAYFWQRPEEPVGHLRAQRPLEEKESQRWLLSYELACQVRRLCPQTRVVSVADREGDIHEWFLDAAERAEEEQAEYLIRAKCNRRVAAEGGNSYLWEAMRAAPVLGSHEVALARQPGRTARTARLELRARRVCFNKARRPGGNLPPVDVEVLYALEGDPPKGEEPIEWMLLTSIPVQDIETAKTLLGWYRSRWEIEIFFRVLKQGCRVEDLRLETPERVERALAVYLIVAWRIHHITRASRERPEAPCTEVFSDTEWETVYLLQKRRKPPSKPPTVRQLTRMLAQLGGFLARKGDGEPGVETVWRGYMVLQQSLQALEIRDAVAARKCV